MREDEISALKLFVRKSVIVNCKNSLKKCLNSHVFSTRDIV